MTGKAEKTSPLPGCLILLALAALGWGVIGFGIFAVVEWGLPWIVGSVRDSLEAGA